MLLWIVNGLDTIELRGLFSGLISTPPVLLEELSWIPVGEREERERERERERDESHVRVHLSLHNPNTSLSSDFSDLPGVGGDTIMSSSLGLFDILVGSSARANFLLARAPAAADVSKGETFIPPCSGAVRGEETRGDSPLLSRRLTEVLMERMEVV